MAWPDFDLQLFGPSNNASSQNAAAQQQIQQAYQQALQNFMQFMQQNPFPLNNIAPPKAGPQLTGSAGPGQIFGGPRGALMGTLHDANKRKKGPPNAG